MCKKIAISHEFMDFAGYDDRRKSVNLAREYIVGLRPQGESEWGNLIKRYDELEASAREVPLRPTQSKDSLMKWLRSFDIDGQLHDRRKSECTADLERQHRPMKTMGVDGSVLYQCSWCRLPSARLRQCGGCGVSR